MKSFLLSTARTLTRFWRPLSRGGVAQHSDRGRHLPNTTLSLEQERHRTEARLLGPEVTSEGGIPIQAFAPSRLVPVSLSMSELTARGLRHLCKWTRLSVPRATRVRSLSLAWLSLGGFRAISHETESAAAQHDPQTTPRESPLRVRGRSLPDSSHALVSVAAN